MSEQSVPEILKRVQTIQIVANRIVDDLFAGQYKSVFRGRGMEFDEVREYQPGDDIRSIDWNVTARTGVPHIKRFCEERELTVLFMLDTSGSGMFGSNKRSKLEMVIELSALLMFSALKNNDKVGLILFCSKVERFFPPRKGKSNVLRLIRELVSAEPIPDEADLSGALEFVNRVQKRRAVVFLISDFLGASDRRSLASANQRHDLTAISVTDPRERSLPDVGFVTLKDPETGALVELDTHHPRVRELFAAENSKRAQQLSERFRRVGMDHVDLATDQDYLQSLRRFFRMREQRVR